MTAQDIITKLFSSPKGVTIPRITKAQALAARSKIDWKDVHAAMTDSQQQAVDDAR